MEAIKRHNILRACHNAEPLMFNCEIMKLSQDYAETEPEGHSNNRNFNGQWMGENYFWSSGMKLTGDYPVNDWYREISNYNFDTGKGNGITGHFTQVVWKNSKEFGIGYHCNGSTCYVIGNYSPGGNFNNDYLNQVQGLQQ